MEITSLDRIGKYRVRRYVNSGAFAWVFEVEDPKFSGRSLALKMLRPDAAVGEEFRRFQSEARLLAQIDHPNLVTIFDFERDEVTGNFYYVMSFIDGPSLKERLKEGPLPVAEAVSIFVDLLDGLSKLHEVGIIHRDIKPGNVLLGRDGRARLADLGIARVQGESGQTRTGVAVGTALYMSPEQARGRGLDHRTDLFSAGLTLYEALTGGVIYDYVDAVDSSSGMDVLMYIGSLVHTHSELDVRFTDDPEIPPSLQSIVLRALRLDPDDRIQTAAEMRDALRDELLAPQSAPVSRRLSRRSVAALGAALALLLTIAGAYLLYWRPRQIFIEGQARAVSQLEETTLVYERAVALASAVRDLSPPPPEALSELVDKRLERAGVYLSDSGEAIVGADFQLAGKDLERASLQQERACQLLVDRFLAARASTDGQALERRVVAMGSGGAEQVAAESWQALGAVLPRLAAPATDAAGCEAAQVGLGRVQAAAEAAPLAEAVRAQMEETWPRIVEEAHQQALITRKLAVAQASDAREYKLALRGAKRLLLQGSRRVRAGDPQAALSAYQGAEKGFITASSIAPAALAREEGRALAERARLEDELDLTDAAKVIARGDEAWAAERWEVASQHYGEAVGKLKELRAAHEWRRAAVKVKNESVAARKLAEAEGAPRSAPTEFAQAEISFSNSQAQLEAGNAKQAELLFASARGEYLAAQKRAIEALRQGSAKRFAVVEQRTRLLGEGECAQLGSPDAQQHCDQAEETLARGSQALEELNAPGALHHFQAATEAYARAASAQLMWDTTRPRPPVLVRRVPLRSLVKVSPRQPHSFAVEANDPNGDILNFTWTVDGEIQAERGPTIKRMLDKNASVVVRVDNGKSGEFVEA